ncbi:hypothetical protein P153DRAFT_371210 [Dothidotthia symphoricarpi CBS 119687]|uniref:T6SS Phospholipase effector Tle1-like catalytic domain-containing protein n=1 Tax=Dothidotthia symphoricarpi CBS 119687 TaxID=1392245 RepID=A0A6A5ZYC7_9PLEO|nr:uncharacterized protein P153DRAFT_371210 [Dothidotthia symphoricarpi CBS 119687]KAF2123883.1 hypothetical protein P153DRAFT_371210 [Dothidotthia symphoricarpi CBS 119687]
MPSATPHVYSATPRPSKRLVIFCDGTWVGRETQVAGAPFSNIRQLANMVGEVQYSSESRAEPGEVHTIRPHASVSSDAASATDSLAGLVSGAVNTSSVDDPSAVDSSAVVPNSNTSDTIIAGYQEGTGLNSNFVEYIWDGATASALSTECINVYKFIVTHYTLDHEIWLFGFSRGSFTVRCVAGMLNNCGIIRRLPSYSEAEIDSLCSEVFRTYRSSIPSDAPQSPECVDRRKNADRIWQVARPIRFMGIIDTVGSLGIPRLSAGVGFDWAPFEFFDLHMSSAVQYVYHAPALHDRLWMFQPCLVLPGSGGEAAVVRQKWFPGTHYDVGRQTFRFVKQSPVNWIEKVLGLLPDLLSQTVFPNEVLSDTVLRWIVQGIQTVDEDSLNPIIPTVPEEIQRLTNRIAAPAPNTTGSGDIYGNILDYAPGGIVVDFVHRMSTAAISFLNGIFPRLGDNIRDALGIKTIIGILTATADRRIPGVKADVYAYTVKEAVMGGNPSVKGVEAFSVEEQAKMERADVRGQGRYASRTLENWLLWKRVFGGGDDDVVS